MNRIFAVVYNKNDDEGYDNIRQAFRFLNTFVQSDVETFMLSIGYGCSDYFLQMESDLVRQDKMPFNYYHDDGEKILLMKTDVEVFQTEKGMRYTVIWENEE